MDANAPAILAEQLKVRGLSAISHDEIVVNVINPLNPHLVEAVGIRDGRYVTNWGYELGEAGDEVGTALRRAFLLGIPTSAHTSDDLSPRR
ncbi:hypothetical protein JK364_41680 [Streptomyces sp. 110]|uniref:Uncharacterized protein n=1 Tax=Streptomyces endocoffeicus TaxID=2898945 RepID=A0ABS1Q2L8_9ACTN|nr:hypothetical protein [Streptomyces endocoffeicus]MBL1118829.1 hypothetical protein [Streptomyces endocoffeicus]